MIQYQITNSGVYVYVYICVCLYLCVSVCMWLLEEKLWETESKYEERWEEELYNKSFES